MTTPMVPLLDSLVLFDASENELGRITPAQFIGGVLKAPTSSELSLVQDAVTGQYTFEFSAGALVTGTRSVIAGAGIGGGGTLDADVTVSLDISSLTFGTTVDTAADQVVFLDATSGQTLRTSSSNLTGGVPDAVPLGSII